METVHPRVCGERAKAQVAPVATLGSSPRVRGTRGDDLDLAVETRFIPACAGNATSRRWSPTWPAVHPSVCGERAARPKVYWE